MRTHTLALVLGFSSDKSVQSLEILQDATEIDFLESALRSGEKDPLHCIYQQRKIQLQQEIDFEDYVEGLLTQPFLDPVIQEHGVQWFRSKIQIEKYKKSEQQAAQVIAEYALKIYEKDPTRTDFTLVSTQTEVRIRIFTIS